RPSSSTEVAAPPRRRAPRAWPGGNRPPSNRPTARLPTSVGPWRAAVGPPHPYFPKAWLLRDNPRAQNPEDWMSNGNSARAVPGRATWMARTAAITLAIALATGCGGGGSGAAPLAGPGDGSGTGTPAATPPVTSPSTPPSSSPPTNPGAGSGLPSVDWPKPTGAVIKANPSNYLTHLRALKP